MIPMIGSTKLSSVIGNIVFITVELPLEQKPGDVKRASWPLSYRIQGYRVGDPSIKAQYVDYVKEYGDLRSSPPSYRPASSRMPSNNRNRWSHHQSAVRLRMTSLIVADLRASMGSMITFFGTQFYQAPMGQPLNVTVIFPVTDLALKRRRFIKIKGLNQEINKCTRQ